MFLIIHALLLIDYTIGNMSQIPSTAVQQLEYGFTSVVNELFYTKVSSFGSIEKNIVGQITWRCCHFQSLKCHATLRGKLNLKNNVKLVLDFNSLW